MFAISIARTAYAFVFKHLGWFFALAGPWIGILTGIFLVEDIRGEGFGIVTEVVRTIMEAFFAFGWHRYYLLGRKESMFSRASFSDLSETERLNLSKATKRFVTNSLVLVLAIVIVLVILVLPLAFLPKIVGDSGLNLVLLLALVFLVISPAFFRLFPFFPALAVGRLDVSFEEIYALTRGAVTRIWAAFILALSPFFAVALFVAIFLDSTTVPPNATPMPVQVLLNLFVAVLSFLWLAVGVSANSEIYRRLTGFEIPSCEPHDANG